MNTEQKEILEISIEDIIPNRFQPRLTFDVEALNELANSIREHGIIQPLVVRRLQDKYEIIAGERRYKAATLVGMQKVPCIIMNLNDNESAEVAVIENIQRKEMTPLEEAKSFKKILDRGYLTQEELARKMGKSQSAIANKLRLLNLDEIVQDAILNNKISERHARSILKLSSKDEQRKILTEILEKRLTVKQTDDLINEKYGLSNNNNTEVVDNNSIFKPISTTEPNGFVPSFINKTGINIPEVNSFNPHPQINIMNGNSDIMEDVSEKPQETEIFKYNTPMQNNTPSNSSLNINDIINPSVFSNDTINSNMNMNVENIKNTAEDINKTIESTNMNQLLHQDFTPKENKFFVDLNVPITENNNQSNNKTQTVIKSINDKVTEIKNTGAKISKEERDLGTSYEIIIRIDK